MDLVLLACLAMVSAMTLYLLYEDWAFVSRPRRKATGTVVGHTKSFSDGSDSYAANVRFSTEDGRSFEVADRNLFSTPRPPVGSNMAVVYPTDAPASGRVHRPWTRTIIYAAMLFMIAVLLGRLFGLLEAGSG